MGGWACLSSHRQEGGSGHWSPPRTPSPRAGHTGVLRDLCLIMHVWHQMREMGQALQVAASGCASQCANCAGSVQFLAQVWAPCVCTGTGVRKNNGKWGKTERGIGHLHIKVIRFLGFFHLPFPPIAFPQGVNMVSLQALNLLQHFLLLLVFRILPHWSEQFNGDNLCPSLYLRCFHGA